MDTNIGKTMRVSDFIDSGDNRGLLLDTTIASCIGAPPGLENLAQVLTDLNYYFDGIIVNPGQAEHHADLLGGRERAAPLVRVDWTNAYRNSDFCLPATGFKHLMISDAGETRELGASAMVASFFMGVDDDSEARNIETLSHLARDCYNLSLPLVVDIQPLGEKVDERNFGESVKLGVSFMQELGADVLIIPESGKDIHTTIGNWIPIPVLVRLNTIPDKNKILELNDAGLSGILLSEQVLAVKDAHVKIKKAHSLLHQ